MAGRPRKPLAVAEAEGRDVMNKGRYEDRVEIDEGLGGLGDAPDWIVDTEDCRALEAWELFRREAPWLKESHRMIVGMAANLQGSLMGAGLDLKGMQALRQMLSSLGMTPADASKVVMAADKEKDDDDLGSRDD